MLGKRRILWFVMMVFLALAVFIYVGRNRFVANSDPVSYVVAIAEENSEGVSVEATFTLEDSLLYSTHEGPDPKAYVPFIRDLHVSDESGNTLNVTPCTSRQILKCHLWKGWERGQKWLVDAEAGTPVVLSYSVALEHAQTEWGAGLDSAAYRTDWGMFFTGRALFVMNGRIRSPFVSANLAWMEGRLVPYEDSRQAIEVVFELPEGWRASTPWTVVGDNSFVTGDLIDLSEAMLMLGTHDAFQTEQGGTAVTLALGGETVLQESERLQEAFGEAHAYYTNVLGGPPKTRRVNPLERTIVIVNSGDATDGEVIGSNISVTFVEGQPVFEVGTSGAGGDDALNLPVVTVFHEFFHLWNAMTFASDAEAEWFKEGVTDYYALRAARQLGYLDEATFFTLLGDQYRRHLEARAGSDLSLTKAGKDEFGNHELLYPGGLLVGLSLDLIIRSGTDNQQSLDDLMKRIYAEYGASGKALGTAAVQELAEELSGTDLSTFFGDYVQGSSPVPLLETMRLAGLEAEFENGKLLVNEDADAPDSALKIRRDVF